MGVTGLWSVLEPSGKRVRLETLQGKVLAVDVSIWLHQSVKGFRDKDGNPLRNAHLLGAFFRVCKLLVYGIRPVFVFDGGVPVLKKQTMAARRQRKIEAQDKSQAARNKLLKNLVRQQLQKQYLQDIPDSEDINAEVERVLKSSRESIDAAVKHTTAKFLKGGRKGKSKSTSPKKSKQKPHDEEDAETFGDDFNKFREKLTENFNNFSVFFNAYEEADYGTESSDSDFDVVPEKETTPGNYDENFSAIVSSTFDELPLNVQHEMLFDMQESRKANSWGRMEQMPKESQNFSSFQLDRLRKRHTLQKKIQSVQKEMGKQHIHLSNFDELDAYNYEEDFQVQPNENAVVAANKDRAILYVPNSAPGSSKSSSQTHGKSTNSGTAGTSQTNPITIDDFVTGDWSSDDEGIKEESNTLTEEEQLQQAIKLSLEQFGEKNKDLFEEGEAQQRASVLKYKNPETHRKSQPEECVIQSSPESIPTPSGSPEPQKLKSEVMVCKIKSDTDGSDSEFEEVEVDEKPVAPAVNLEELFQNLKKEPVITVDIQKSEVLEDDIFADVFASKIPSRAQLTNLKNSLDKLKEVGRVEKPATIDLSCVFKERSPKKSVEFISIEESDFDAEMIDFGKQFEPAPVTTIDEISEDEETNRPKATLGADPGKSVRMISAQYMQAQEKINVENEKLMSAKGFQERVATTITDQMYSEAQELLSLFGVPFLISPMEAEAQCAFLDTACLTEGTLTDDSDVWLFGGQRVYKNFFSQGERPVELFQYSDIVSSLNLDREKMVLMALLTGSDYTVGVEGVGPVKAVEIVSEFNTSSIDSFDILVQFRDWWEKAQKDRTLDKGNKLREQLRKIRLKPGFPNRAVWEAYFEPAVDQSLERFRWGKPDLDAIRVYLHEKFGWDEKKCTASLLPLTKAVTCGGAETSRQITLDRFLSLESARDSVPGKKKSKSKRMIEAMQKLKKPPSATEIQLSSEESSGEECFQKTKTMKTTHKTTAIAAKRKRKSGKKKSEEQEEESLSENEKELDELLHRMGVKRKKVQRHTSEGDATPGPSQRPKNSRLALPKMKPSKSLMADVSGVPMPSISPKVTPVKQSPVIPQKAREQEQKLLNKKKAIELLRKRRDEK